MIGVALKGLAGRKIRALLTAFAIVIGVSMVSGTFILTDTMQKTFDGLFTASYDETDAVIQGKEIVELLLQRLRPPCRRRCSRRSGRCPRSESASGAVSPAEASNAADIIGSNGKTVGQESIGASYRPRQRAVQPAQAQVGRVGRGPGAGRDRRRHRRRRSTTRSATRSSISTLRQEAPYELTGTASFGDVDSLGFATIAVWDVETAQTLLHREGRFDSISIAAKEGTSPTELVERVQPLMPGTLAGQGQRQAGRGRRRRTSTAGWTILRYFLLGFGAIALFVGAFVIFNTLSITVAQRTREFATLRTLGASRKQVMRSVRLEGLVIGLLASVIGLVLGLGIAKGMIALFTRLGRRPAGRRDGLRAAHGHRLDPARHGHHAAREHPARAARDPRAADRGGPRGRGAAGVALRRALAQGRRSAWSLASVAAISAGIFAGGVSGGRGRRCCSAAACSGCSWASRCSRRASSSRWPASSAGRRAAPVASPASWRAPTPSATRAARPRPPPR